MVLSYLIRCSGNISMRNLSKVSVLNARRSSAREDEEIPLLAWERALRLMGWLTQGTESQGFWSTVIRESCSS